MSKEFNLRVGGMNLATVRHRRVPIGGKSESKKYGNMFYEVIYISRYASLRCQTYKQILSLFRIEKINNGFAKHNTLK